jgi:transcriptional regulator with XRE-family HTH domain
LATLSIAGVGVTWAMCYTVITIDLGGENVGERALEPISVALAAVLAERGTTQAGLCRATGLDRSTVSRYLSSGRGTTIDDRSATTIEKIAAALDVEPDYFLEYRRWRIQCLALAHPGFVDDFYDLIIEMARYRGLLGESGQKDAKH